jgi:multidrug efflux pump subunit AcrA (membrane-fusion protein)
LAKLDSSEQRADLDAATAAMAASESQLRVAAATFQRQKTLLSNGFTTRVSFDQAQEGLKSAEASLEDAKAQLGKAKEALGDTELRADAAGVITARRLETGQVVQAAQPVSVWRKTAIATPSSMSMKKPSLAISKLATFRCGSSPMPR